MIVVFLFMFFVGVMAAAVFSVPSAWVVMLLLGVAHSFEPAVPAIGFWLTWLLVLAARVALVPITPTVKLGD